MNTKKIKPAGKMTAAAVFCSMLESGEPDGFAWVVYRWICDCAALACSPRGLNWEKVFRKKRGEPDYLFSWAQEHAAKIDDYPEYERFYQEAQDAIGARISGFIAAKIGRPFIISPKLAETRAGKAAAEDAIRGFITGNHGARTDKETRERNERSRAAGAGLVEEHYLTFSAPGFCVYCWLIDGEMTGITAVTEEEYSAGADALGGGG